MLPQAKLTKQENVDTAPQRTRGEIMKFRSKTRIVLTVLCLIIGMLMCVLIVASVSLHIRTRHIRNDYSSVYTNAKYQSAVSVDGINVIRQEVSCGYAVLEMFSEWCGQSVTEEGLYAEYRKVVTSTGKAFCNEMNKQFPDYHTVMYKYLTDTELIDKVYDSLADGFPVPFEWAALYKNEWTLHYSLIVGMDVVNDTVTVANPYGYYETISIKEFLDRTSFEVYADMPFYFELAFAFGIFEKNTIFVVE